MRRDHRAAGLWLRDRRGLRAAAVAVATVLAGPLLGACGGTARASLEPSSTPRSARDTAALPTRTSSAPAAQPNLRPPVVAVPGQGPAVTYGPAPAGGAATTTPDAGGSPGATTTLPPRSAAGPSCRAADAQRSAAVVAYAKSLLPMTPVRSGPATNSHGRTWSTVPIIENDTGNTNMVVLVHCVGMEWTVVASGHDRAHVAPCTDVIPADVRRALGVC